MPIPENITDPQKLGSCITYFRRYTLKSLLAIAETDDDGNFASTKVNKVKTTPKLTAQLRACKTLLELQELYLSLTKEEQKHFAGLKNELKTKLK